jgi:hypothetical protein
MAITLAAALQDANYHQKKALEQGIPRLLRQYRHTGEVKPIMKLISKTMFMGWAPKGEFKTELERLNNGTEGQKPFPD